nr:protein lhcp translocation defect [Quercus suber]
MASIPCTTHLPFTFKPSTSPSSFSKTNLKFVGVQNRLGWFRPSKLGPSNGSRAKCWFKFGKNGVDAEGAGIYGSQSRDDFDRDDVEQNQELGMKNVDFFRPSKLGPSNGSRAKCWFKFGKNGVDAEGAGIYGSQSRDDFDRDDVEQYFNYMGMLAVEGSYDKMDALLNQNIHPVDILLLMAASEGDKPKIEELLRAGASYTVKDADGRTALDRAANDEIKDFILSFSVQKA